MTWLGLDALTRPLRPLVARLPPEQPVRAGTAAVVAHYGVIDESNALLVNVGVLAVLSRGLPPLYLCRPSASRVVHETDLHAIPHEPPRLLRGPGIIEARRPETGERLWGDVAALGWYTIPGEHMSPPQESPATFLLGIGYPSGSWSARWMPDWTGEDIEPELPEVDNSRLIDVMARLGHLEFARAAARYLIVFGLLAEVEHGPLRFELEHGEQKRRHVYLGPRKATKQAKIVLPDPAPPQRAQADVQVTGHLKRQRIGEGRAKVKWIYVEGYSSRRWVSPRWTVERDHKAGGLANDRMIFRG